jgi:hypothetical protein
MANLKDTGHDGLCVGEKIRISLERSRLVLQKGWSDGELLDLQTGRADGLRPWLPFEKLEHMQV